MEIKNQVGTVRNQETIPKVLQTLVFILLQLLKHLGQVDNHSISYIATKLLF